MTKTATTYGKDIVRDDLKEALDAETGSLDNEKALAIAEFFGQNNFGKWRDLNNEVAGHIQDLVSLRVFDGEKQLKLRRVGDDVFRVVSDFPVDGWEEITTALEFSSETQIALWGYVSDKLNKVLYEEQIPMVLEYPEPINCNALYPLSTGEKEKTNRFSVEIELFSDESGSVCWDRFINVVPWAEKQGRLPGQEL